MTEATTTASILRNPLSPADVKLPCASGTHRQVDACRCRRERGRWVLQLLQGTRAGAGDDQVLPPEGQRRDLLLLPRQRRDLHCAGVLQHHVGDQGHRPQ